MNTTPGSLRLPSQAAPIDRTSVTCRTRRRRRRCLVGLSDDITAVAGPLLGKPRKPVSRRSPAILGGFL